MNAALDELARAAGIVRQYRDGAGRAAFAPDETLIAILAAMGITAGTEGQAHAALERLRGGRGLPQWAVATPGQRLEIPVSGQTAWVLELEGGQTREGRADAAISLGPLPLGYHLLRAGDAVMPVLCAPERLADVPRGWGIMVPLYGLKPVGQGGVGDFADLADAAQSLGRAGAGFVGINPVHAGFPGDDTNFSPYAPSSRERLATHHVAVPHAPPPDGALIDYGAALPAQRVALEAGFARFEADGGDDAFDAWRAAEGPALEIFATHQALADLHGPYWPAWPLRYQSPDSAETAAFAAAHPGRLRAHAWRQWMAETQLGAARRAALSAGMTHGLYLDLAVGTHPGGAETWADPDLFVRGVSQGAPPDAFSPDPQVWNLAPMRPDVLTARGFAPLARILRRQLRHAGILRIDHILGFERAFWVPDGLPGAYVTMPRAALLAVLKIEAARAGAVIVGEDLGAVPEGFRDELAASGILGCRVAMFERDWQGDRGFIRPGDYAELSVASFGSHDLPLWRGWRAGTDIGWRARLGSLTPQQAAEARAARRRDVAAFDAAAGMRDGELCELTGFLARSRARLVALQIEDLLGEVEQPNLPGTIHDHPNWRRRLRVVPQKLGATGHVARTAAIMTRQRR